MARKREERTAKAAYKKERKTNKLIVSKEDEQNFASFNKHLATMGLELREVPGDGNCLFRALGDQLDGHTNNHIKHREDTVEYMRQFRKDFEPFVEDDEPFESHVQNLQKPGTYAGNDAIVAFGRRNAVTVVIHQLNSPLWKMHGGEKGKPARELHIAYHNGDHYNSVRKIGDNSQEPANIHLSVNDDNVNNQQKFSLPVYYEGDEISDDDENVSLDSVQVVMARTGCQDPLLVEQTLEQYQNNVDASVDFVINMMILSQSNLNDDGNSLWNENGTGTRIFGELNLKSNGFGEKQQQSKSFSGTTVKTDTKKHLSNKQRKDLKKHERKMNSELRKKQKKQNQSSDSDLAAEILPNVVQKIGCLNI